MGAVLQLGVQVFIKGLRSECQSGVACRRIRNGGSATGGLERVRMRPLGFSDVAAAIL